MRARILLVFFLVGSLQCSAIAQQQQPATAPPKPPPTQQPEVESQDVIRITTNLVQIDAVVTKDGKQVTDLQAEDFELFEDGHAQPITNFSYISNVPGDASLVTPKPPPAKSKDKTTP